MKKSKKILSLVLVLAMCLSMSAMAVEMEETTTENIVLTNKEMFEYSSQNAIDNPDSLQNVKVVLKNEEGESYSLDAFEYSHSTKSIDNTGSITYVFSTQPENMQLTRATGNASDNKWDSSISVYGTLTVNYDYRICVGSLGQIEYLITSVVGSWEVSDNSVSLSERCVVYACKSSVFLEQHEILYPSSNSFNYVTGFEDYMIDDGVTTVVAAQSSVELRHGSASIWELSCEVTIVNNGDSLIFWQGKNI